MQFMPTNVLTPDDWLVTYTFEGGERVVKGCSPKMDRDRAIWVVMQLIPPHLRGKVVDVTAIRRRDKGLLEHHPEVTRRLQA